MQSTCTRLSNRRRTGPKKIKPYEAVNQLEKFTCNWKEENVDMTNFIDETLNLMENRNLPHLPLKLKCTECGKSTDYLNKRITHLNAEQILNLGPLSIGDILKKNMQ